MIKWIAKCHFLKHVRGNFLCAIGYKMYYYYSWHFLTLPVSLLKPPCSEFFCVYGLIGQNSFCFAKTRAQALQVPVSSVTTQASEARSDKIVTELFWIGCVCKSDYGLGKIHFVLDEDAKYFATEWRRQLCEHHNDEIWILLSMDWAKCILF